MKCVRLSGCAFASRSWTGGRAAAGVIAAAVSVTAVAPIARADSAVSWGYNASGQLGDGTTTNNPSPLPVTGFNSGVTGVASSFQTSYGIQNGGLYAWGNNGGSPTIGNEYGDGTNISSTVPVLVPTLSSGVTFVASGFTNALVLQGGALYGIGNNSNGNLGNGTTLSTLIPVPVSNMSSGVTAAATGGKHSLVVQNGAVYSFGAEDEGALGINMNTMGTDITTPTAITSLASGVTAVGAGVYDSFAIKGGALYSWGNNQSGQLGVGSTTPEFDVPTAVALLNSGVTGVAVGNSFTLGLANGAVYAWGLNTYGELGNGTVTTTKTYSPQLVPGITGKIVAVATDEASAFALSSDGSLWVWGANPYGELGLGYNTTTGSMSVNTPTQILPPSGFVYTSLSSTFYGDATVATLAAVPEPASLALLSLVTTLPLVRRRSRRA